jgi:exopolysaccharide biosynthesis polyprenyl glycosylphosphotransferase
MPSTFESTGAGHQVARRTPTDREPRSLLLIALVAVDALAVLIAWSLAFSLARPSVGGFDGLEQSLLCFGLTIVTLVAIASQALYRARTSVVRSVETLHLLRACALAGLVAFAVGRAEPSLTARLVLLGAAACFVSLRLARSGFASWVRAQRRRGHFVRTVVLIGANEEAARVASIVRDHPELGYSIVGVAGDRDDYQRLGFVEPWIGPVAAALFAARAQEVTGGIIAPSAVDPTAANRLAREFLAQGFHVQMTSGLSRIDQRRLRVQHLMHEPVIYVEPALAPLWARLCKRAIDIAVALTTLVLVAPVLLVVAVAVRWESPGPIVFRQPRVGRDGNKFVIFKFRTMVRNAEEQLDELIEQNQRSGPLFKLSDDPRVTRVGRLLRKASLDELPQLFNVLRGDMSLVGPRPALETEVAEFDEELRGRLAMLPGITGLWQIEARDNPSFDAYRRLDLFYVENWSLGLDLVILARTALAVAARALRALHPRPRTDRSAQARYAATLD